MNSLWLESKHFLKIPTFELQEGRAGPVKEADLPFQAKGISFHECWMISTEPGGNGLSAMQDACLWADLCLQNFLC